jgi:nitric oxide dioxygenase
LPSPVDASTESLLSPASLDVVQATASVVAAHANEITARFYPRMFAAHPELLRPGQPGHGRAE